ncbi:MAG TPA: diacylglycerol kinase family protein [Actinophytocola sp.]|nr:diacylglycerol kinase family protein [Actinophytocola sp.]
MRVLIVANRAAGNASPALIDEVVRRCRPVSGADPSTVDLVVAVGGDGTAGSVAGRVGSTPLFIVPAGTANSFYRTLWGSTPWRAALDLALAGAPATSVDLARVAELDRVSLSGACTGFTPRAVHEAKRAGTGYGPALAALAGGYRPYPGRVLVDGRVVHSGPTMLANVGGGRYRGGEYALLPHTILDDGLLDVCVLGGEHDLREMLVRTRTGSHVDLPGVVYARGRRIRLERTDGRPLWFEHDGEVVPRTRSAYTLEVMPGAVRVVADPRPRSAAA